MSLAADQIKQPEKYRYQVYGLTVDSALEIPELSPAGDDEAEASIRIGPVAEQLDDATKRFDEIEYRTDTCLLKIPEVGRFLIENGNSITRSA